MGIIIFILLSFISFLTYKLGQKPKVEYVEKIVEKIVEIEKEPETKPISEDDKAKQKALRDDFVNLMDYNDDIATGKVNRYE